MAIPSDFMFKRGKLLGSQDLDSLGISGIFECRSGVNAPDTGHFYIFNVESSLQTTDIRPTLQLAWDADDGAMSARVRTTTTWSAWAAVGGGAGSGDVVGPASATDNDFAQFDGVTGKLIKDGISLDTDDTLAANSDTRVPSQQAVKAYVDASAGADLGDFTFSGFTYGIGAVTLFRFPTDAGFASSSLFLGDGGANLTHTAGEEGRYNVGIGLRCLTNIEKGQYNTFGGFEAGEDIVNNSYNTGFGEATQIYNFDGDGNSTFGWKAGLGTDTVGLGDYNCFFGYSSCIAPTTAVTHNCAFGAFTLADAAYSGDGNTVMGYGSGLSLTSGDDNVFLGFTIAGNGITTGSSNTLIGAGISGLAAGTSNLLRMKAGTTQASFPIGVTGGTPIAISGQGASHTGNTTATVLATITIPANALGPNGVIRVTALMNFTGTAGTKTLIVAFDGTDLYGAASAAADLSGAFTMHIKNDGATNAQICPSAPTSGGRDTGFSVNGQATSAKDTTANRDITIKGQLGNAADTFDLVGYIVEIIPGA